MKQIGNQDGGSHAAGPTGGGEARSSASDGFVIVPLPADFDMNSVFQSEDEPVATVAALPAVEAVAPPVAAAAPLVEAVAPPVQTVSHPVEAVAPPVGAVARPVEIVAPPVVERPARLEPSPRDLTKAASVSVADLIENHVRLEWHEAVAIAQHLCHVMVHDPAANIHHSLVEPWNVEITKSGDVQVLPGGSSSDPIVKQVGRVLGALLQDSIAPAELRLVASQASFEVPVYSSVDELSAALRRFEHPGGLDAIRAAFQRGLEAKFSVTAPPPPPARVAPEAAAPPAEIVRTPKTRPVGSPLVPRVRSRRVPWQFLAAAAAVLVAIPIVIRLGAELSKEAPLTQVEPVQRQAEIQTQSPQDRKDAAPHPALVRPAPVAAQPALNPIAPTVSHREIAPVAVPRVPVLRARQLARSSSPVDRAATAAATEAERRAAGLFASGRGDEAAIIFDALVLKNPFYQLDPARASPEAVAALRSSKRALLPVLAQRQYDEARAAFDAGDYSLAIANGERAVSMLNDADAGSTTSDLSAIVQSLLTLASTARTAEEERIYTVADPGVTPPRPMGRQLSAASLPRALANPTGRLEILVGRSGRVETVKLDTPSNGYHDRMLVSAVKAWRYRPALRNGKPVRFSIELSISLPDS